jgi:CRISPR-associated endonuclease/helicase Cas3
VEQYFAYWGKARPQDDSTVPCHLLPFHSLDVAACAKVLLELPGFKLESLAEELKWPGELASRLFVFWAAMHDVGKFSCTFQDLAPDLLPRTPQGKKLKPVERQRHDTMGWLLWRDQGRRTWFGRPLREGADEFWDAWMRVMTGHHGLPPKENFGFAHRPKIGDYYAPGDIEAAASYVRDLIHIFLPGGLPEPDESASSALPRHSWRLAGLAVLADWLGSNAGHFPYRNTPQPLSDYWKETALPRARQAIRAAGLEAWPVRPWNGANDLLTFKELTPLQSFASTADFGDGPQFFLLEDVTGAGKTEAAFILAHRLMAARRAQGLYFALPTMATANQMYERTAGIYRRLYTDEAQPSLVLSHGARRLVKGFRDSVLSLHEIPLERNNQESQTASAQCAAWLADSRKKALLADVGVGTVDQALLGVLQVRHQSLRLVGLAGKVLIVDEVHAYDDYMSRLLEALVEAQAMQGGSVVLLSATVPAFLRRRLIEAFARGCGRLVPAVVNDARYPLATHASGGMLSNVACDARRELVRSVSIHPLHREQETVETILRSSATGQCVCWIRNTVDDARRGYKALCHAGAERVRLFHSRFVMGDRLRIEGEVLQAFGRESGPNQRRGQILVATQVVEQSLDLDFDVLVSDLAPVDLLIQRAGRLHRHARMADGARAADDAERRGQAVFHLLCPEFTDQPKEDWYARMFPKAQFVYPDTGKLWLTQKALLEAGSIVTPGEPGQAGSVRRLVESVYGGEAEAIPEALKARSQKVKGKARADVSLASFNSIDLAAGYAEGLMGQWYEESRVATRLSEEGRLIYLAREEDESLRPLLDAEEFAWDLSAVRVDARRIDGLAEEWKLRFGEAIEALRKRCKLLEGDAFVLPMVRERGVWMGMGADGGNALKVTYEKQWGLELESVAKDHK